MKPGYVCLCHFCCWLFLKFYLAHLDQRYDNAYLNGEAFDLHPIVNGIFYFVDSNFSNKLSQFIWGVNVSQVLFTIDHDRIKTHHNYITSLLILL